MPSLKFSHTKYGDEGGMDLNDRDTLVSEMVDEPKLLKLLKTKPFEEALETWVNSLKHSEGSSTDLIWDKDETKDAPEWLADAIAEAEQLTEESDEQG
jgi:hypothetical protein